MKKLTVLGFTMLLFVICAVVVTGCGLQGSALSTKNMLDAMKTKNTKLLAALCAQNTKTFINSGFAKEIYGKSLPLDYLVDVAPFPLTP